MSQSFPLRAGKTDEHYTPPEVFSALGCRFDLDPCSPTDRTHICVPANQFFTPDEDGLTQPWDGFVWLNPPFGGRNGIVPWLKRFVAHGNGIVLVNALTSAGWFHDYAPWMDAILFPCGKTKFVQTDGTVAKSPQGGIALMAMGQQGKEGLRRAARSGYGLMLTREGGV
ncbi:adenine methyltransferase [Gluconobacter cerevisiae]|uniref:Adenine methyltransferase n=1 Tax=Gluconobacter cerevisiae TaxID=1379734 RepID=A0ABR9YFB8_9PROT|nr:DNA N-6-adenine-methyltransferase [Gluconobacter cerevisiae]MBF0877218.1 adenine methyltransferase [Gluconobacter cerevisiae]